MASTSEVDETTNLMGRMEVTLEDVDVAAVDNAISDHIQRCIGDRPLDDDMNPQIPPGGAKNVTVRYLQRLFAIAPDHWNKILYEMQMLHETLREYHDMVTAYNAGADDDEASMSDQRIIPDTDDDTDASTNDDDTNPNKTPGRYPGSRGVGYSECVRTYVDDPQIYDHPKDEDRESWDLNEIRVYCCARTRGALHRDKLYPSDLKLSLESEFRWAYVFWYFHEQKCLVGDPAKHTPRQYKDLIKKRMDRVEGVEKRKVTEANELKELESKRHDLSTRPLYESADVPEEPADPDADPGELAEANAIAVAAALADAPDAEDLDKAARERAEELAQIDTQTAVVRARLQDILAASNELRRMEAEEDDRVNAAPSEKYALLAEKTPDQIVEMLKEAGIKRDESNSDAADGAAVVPVLRGRKRKPVPEATLIANEVLELEEHVRKLNNPDTKTRWRVLLAKQLRIHLLSYTQMFFTDFKYVDLNDIYLRCMSVFDLLHTMSGSILPPGQGVLTAGEIAKIVTEEFAAQKRHRKATIRNATLQRTADLDAHYRAGEAKKSMEKINSEMANIRSSAPSTPAKRKHVRMERYDPSKDLNSDEEAALTGRTFKKKKPPARTGAALFGKTGQEEEEPEPNAQTPRRSTRARDSMPFHPVHTSTNFQMPPSSDAHKKAITTIAKLIDGPEFQHHDLAGAMKHLGITNGNYLRMAFQSPDITLKWWQCLGIHFMHIVIQRRLTKGGGVFDYIGLGKTWEYGGYIHLDSVTAVRAWDDAPDDSKPECKPWLVVTLASLINETATTLTKFSPGFLIVHILHSDSRIKGQKIKTITDGFAKPHSLHDKRNHLNNRSVIVTSYETWASVCGPASMLGWAKDNGKEVSTDKVSPPLLPDWPRNPQGRYRGIICDEPQNFLRNHNTYRTAIKYANADQVWLFSGSPAPRGLADYSSYMGLISRPDREQKAVTHFKSRIKTIFYDGGKTFQTQSNPFTLDEDHPAREWCYTQRYFDHFIGEPSMDTGTRHDAHKEMSVQARDVLRHISIRRDYDSKPSPTSDVKVADDIPVLDHYAMEAVFSPSGQAEYNAGYEQWKRRFMSTSRGENGAGGDAPASSSNMPNPRTIRALGLIQWFSPLRHLHLPNNQYVAPEPDAPRLTEEDKKLPQHQKDYNSWFWGESKLYKGMPLLKGDDMDTCRYLLHAIMLTDTYQANPLWPEVQDPEDIKDTAKWSNAQVVRLFVQYSPKLGMILGLLMKHVALRGEKIIVWFKTPEMQNQFAEILVSIPGLKGYSEVIDANTKADKRETLRKWFNDPKHNLRILLANEEVSGVGTNFQYGCCRQIVVEVPASYDKELQVIGRCYRLGAKYPNIVYSIYLAECIDDRTLTNTMNYATVAGKAAMIRCDNLNQHQILVEEANSPFRHIPFDRDDELAGWFVGPGDYGGKTYYRLCQADGIEVMRQMVDEGYIEMRNVPDKLFHPTHALQKMMRSARSQMVVQHGGLGVHHEENLLWVRTQELQAREAALGSQLAVPQGFPKHVSLDRPRLVADNAEAFQPTAELWWDEWDDIARRKFRKTYERQTGHKFKHKPPMTEAYKEAHPRKNAKAAGKSKSAPGRATRSTAKRGQKASAPSYKSAEFVEESGSDSELSEMDSDDLDDLEPNETDIRLRFDA